MARLFGFYANQSDRIRCALALEGLALTLGNDDTVEGWGVGSYQAGEVLLRRKPTESRTDLAFAELVQNLRTDAAIVHVRSRGGVARTLENTQPFRFRQYLFAHTGSIPGFAKVRATLSEQVPDFLLRQVRGETDGELLFVLLLGFIHETGRLDDAELDRKALAEALHRTVQAVDAITDAASLPRASINCIVTNDHAMVALRRGLPMAWLRRQGIRDCKACRKQPDVTGREPKRVDHEQLKYVIVASDYGTVPDGWYELPDQPGGSILMLDGALDAQVMEL